MKRNQREALLETLLSFLQKAIRTPPELQSLTTDQEFKALLWMSCVITHGILF